MFAGWLVGSLALSFVGSFVPSFVCLIVCCRCCWCSSIAFDLFPVMLFFRSWWFCGADVVAVVDIASLNSLVTALVVLSDALCCEC